jgi:VCBS repeat-containing protein
LPTSSGGGYQIVCEFVDGDIGFSTDEDTAFSIANVFTNDTDPNGDPLTLQTFDTTGTLGLVTSNGNGTFDYDPDGHFESLVPGEQATDTFTYTIRDGHGGTDTATVTITINGVQDDFNIYLPMVMR